MDKKPVKNVVLTGMPRSGTTLVAAFIDSMPDSVALNEPEWQYRWLNRNTRFSVGEEFAMRLQEDFADQRYKLLNGIPVWEKRMNDGTPTTNYFRVDKEKEQQGVKLDHIMFTRPGLTNDFTLAIKHPGLYLAVLDEIVKQRFDAIIATVRHPLGVVASWNDVEVPPRAGKLKGAELLWEEMRVVIEHPAIGLLEKQVRMYDLMCARLYELRHKVHVLKYEDFIDNPALLSGLIGKEPTIHTQLNKRENSFYAFDIESIKQVFRRVGHHYKHFYEL